MGRRRVTGCTTNVEIIIEDNAVGISPGSGISYLQFSSGSEYNGCYIIGSAIGSSGSTVAGLAVAIYNFGSCEDCLTNSPVKTTTSCIDNSVYFIQSFNSSPRYVNKNTLPQLVNDTSQYLTFSEGSVPNGCYYLTSANTQNTNIVSTSITGFTMCYECIDYLFQISGCNDSNSYILTGIVEGSGTTPGSVVTFNTPKPVWTNSRGSVRTQCDSVAIGGFNGLNS